MFAMITWRNSLGLTQRQAAERLGLSRRVIQKYEAGVLPVPKTVQLACAAVSAGLTVEA